ncbi:MAG: hypothetical protein J2P26_07405, partial [Nocardiopsaceae bacterium]|nr:hypothetical protein [Nocardiopsaceae bacterium]
PAHARAAARDLAHAHALNLARDLTFASDLKVARDAALAAGRALGIQQVDGLAAALLDGVLDDFTDADLTAANLAETDLAGVRWSVSGTRWPSGTDVDALRARSREIAPDTGVFVVEAPGDGKENRHDVRV